VISKASFHFLKIEKADQKKYLYYDDYECMVDKRKSQLRLFVHTCKMVNRLTSICWPIVYDIAVLPKLFSTATQFLKRQSIATHIALTDKKSSSKKKKVFLFIIEYNFTKNSIYFS
jgi:hypothetical protein